MEKTEQATIVSALGKFLAAQARTDATVRSTHIAFLALASLLDSVRLTSLRMRYQRRMDAEIEMQEQADLSDIYSREYRAKLKSEKEDLDAWLEDPLLD